MVSSLSMRVSTRIRPVIEVEWKPTLLLFFGNFVVVALGIHCQLIVSSSYLCLLNLSNLLNGCKFKILASPPKPIYSVMRQPSNGKCLNFVKKMKGRKNKLKVENGTNVNA